MKKNLVQSDNEQISKEIKEGNETVSIEGCKRTCTKRVINHTGTLVKRMISITDLGVQKKNGHFYRIYDIKETESVVDEKTERQ
ncbi:putative metal-binding protein [Methanomicrobium sp. W14]|nr:putative metal-binding protein [Methanomicrobium sp. W14]